MTKRKNVLWIMADQLRWDYLSCYGNKRLHTPNIDRIAAMGVRFERAYIQSPICGPSRMSCYTGRYARSHGSTWNGIPLRVGEQTLGDHLRELDARCVLVGKTHMVADVEGMKRLGIEPNSVFGARIRECGFDLFERDDGLHPNGDYDPHPRYDDYLRSHGMDGRNPWEEWANSAVGRNGELLSGWFLENAHLPARVPEEHSETAYLTSRGIDFMQQAGDKPWLCHLSYIKPHWPYLAPAPYHNMYSAEDLPPIVRSERERMDPHPVLRAWQESRVARTFWRDDVRNRVGPAYMGLVKQLDDHIGRLLEYLEKSGRLKDTMIVMSSDHGDNLGDHWIGEKDLFYDSTARVPLIIYDPDPAADTTRGTVRDDLVEAIDLVPTFIEYFGGKPKPHIIEGRSLMPLLEGKSTAWREVLFSEYDYSVREARLTLGLSQADARLVLAFDGRWKYIHAHGFRPLLFDLQNDPSEFVDLGEDPAYEKERRRLAMAIYDWSLQHHNRVTISAEQIDSMAAKVEPPGILIGYWSPSDLDTQE